MIRICREPKIIPNEDRWGSTKPGFWLLIEDGYVEEDHWKEMQRFQNGDLSSPLLMNMCYQFNTVTPESLIKNDLNKEYHRHLMFFGTKKDSSDYWVEWTPKYIDKLSEIQKECDRLNNLIMGI